MKAETINKILNIKESYQLHDALMSRLSDKQKRIEMFNDFLEYETDLSYDWFTNYFQESHSDRKNMMQDYTPDCVCKIISEMASGSKILDECAGIGGLSISTWTKNKNATFVCEELSDNSLAILLFNMAIRNINGYVKKIDVLSNACFKVYKLASSSDGFSDIEEVENNSIEFDICITNPPYSLKFNDIEKYTDDECFSRYGIPPKAKSDYGFILRALSKLNHNGSMYAILPHGVLFRGAKEQDIRKKLIEDNLLDAVIGLPEKLFLNTSIPVVILALKKNRSDKDIMFIDASEEFEKRGSQNVMTQEHIDKLLLTYKQRLNIDKYSKKITFNEVLENDFNLNIPRYIDTFEEPEPIDIKSVVSEIIDLENQINETNLQLAKMLREIKGDADYEIAKNDLIEHLEQLPVSHAEMFFNVEEFIKDNPGLKEQKKISLFDVATVERSKKDKVYPSGSILIQLSATKGQMLYQDKESKVDSKYGVITATSLNSRYLFHVLQLVMPDFLRRYQTGINIVPEVFKHLKFTIHTDDNIQDLIVKIMNKFDSDVNVMNSEVEQWRLFKQEHLNTMLV